MFPGSFKECDRGQISFFDPAKAIQTDIGNWGKFIEVDISLNRCLELVLRFSESKG